MTNRLKRRWGWSYSGGTRSAPAEGPSPGAGGREILRQSSSRIRKAMATVPTAPTTLAPGPVAARTSGTSRSCRRAYPPVEAFGETGPVPAQRHR